MGYGMLSLIYEEEKNYEAAEAILREGLPVVKDRIEVRYQLGSLLNKTGRLEESIREMEYILEENPEHADALNFIGYTYAEMGTNLVEAEEMILKALQLKPGNGYILDSLGWVYFKQSRYSEALKYLKQAVAALPEDATITEHLGDVYQALKRPQDAVGAYRRALEANPGSATLKEKIDNLLKQGVQ